jgi:hypothetical protein
VFSGSGASLTAVDAATGDAAVDFFGAGVDAVTDTTTCTDVEGNRLTIAGGVLGVDVRTIRVPILDWATLGDPNGNAYFDTYTATATNDIFASKVLAFTDTATKDNIHGRFTVPDNYTDSANLVIVWTTTATVGDVEWGFQYRAVGGNDTESLDQTTPQESLISGNNDTAPSATDERMTYTIALTDGNFAANDTVEYIFSRVGTDAGDTISATVIVHELYFEYQDG